VDCNKTVSKPSFTPGSIGQTAKKASKKVDLKRAETKDIWCEDDVEMQVDLDPRPAPEYDISYLQKVSSEDMYLGMSGRTPSIGHSDELILKVKLPGAKLKEIELNCTENTVDLSTLNL
jgi:hypothetical protein